MSASGALQDASTALQAAIKTCDAASHDDARLASSASVATNLALLREATADIESVQALRENASQAKAWDAIEAVLRHPKLVFSASLANELAATAEALYARGDAGGQLYAAARGLHECCGDVASIASSLQSQQKLSLQPGARAAACVVLGALCATYPRRLGPGSLGEARQRLAKLARSDAATKAAASRALGRVVLASPDEGLTGVAPRPCTTAQHRVALLYPGRDCVAALAKVLKGSDDAACRRAAALALGDIAERAAPAADRAVACLAAAAVDAAEAAKTAPAPKAPPKKDDAKVVPDDPVKRARSAVDAALHLLDVLVETAARHLHDEDVLVRVHGGRACGVALAAHVRCATATRARFAATQNRADGEQKVDSASPPRRLGSFPKMLVRSAAAPAEFAKRTSPVAKALSGSDGRGPCAEDACLFVCGQLIRHAKAGSRAGIAGSGGCLASLLKEVEGTLQTTIRATLSPLRGLPSESPLHATIRAALADALRRGLGETNERRQREVLRALLTLAGAVDRHRDDVTAKGRPLGDGELQVVLAECAHLTASLGAAAAPEAEALERAALTSSSDPAFGVRCEATALGGALALSVPDRAASLATMALRGATAEHHALVDLASAPPAGAQARPRQKDAAQLLRGGMCALHGGTALASAVLRASVESTPYLLDEALAVAEGLVMRQHDDLLSAGALVACARAGWGVLGAVVASSSLTWLRTRARRLSEVWQRSIEWAGDESSQAAAEVRVTCLEACLSSVAALCESGSPLLEGKLGQDVARLLTQTRTILSSKALQTSRSFARLALCAAALLEAQASLPALEDPTSAFRWCAGLFLSTAAPGDHAAFSNPIAALKAEAPASTTFEPRDVVGCDDDLLLATHASLGLGPGDAVALGAGACCDVVDDAYAANLAVRYGDALGPGERDVLASLAVGSSGDLPVERAGETRARLVDAGVRCLRALIPRVDADAQRQGLDALAGALETALNPAKLAMMASDDDRRKRDLRCAASARNASMALLACVSNLPRTYATRPDPTADPFSTEPPRLLSDAPFGDRPRDALARALAAASPCTRRTAAAALAALAARLPDARARLGAARALADACSRQDAPKSHADGARRAAAAPAVADLAREKILTAPSACDVLASPLTKGNHATTATARAWAVRGLADAVPGLVDADADRRRPAVALVLDALEAQLAAPFYREAPKTVSGTAQAITETRRPENAFGFDGATVLACCIARCVAALAAPTQRTADAALARRYARVAEAVARLDVAGVDAYLKRCAAAALPALVGVLQGPLLALKLASLTDAAAAGDAAMMRTLLRVKAAVTEAAVGAVAQKCAAHASVACVERSQRRVACPSAPRWRGLFLPRGFERREAAARDAVRDAQELLAATARADGAECRAATAWLCVLGAEQPQPGAAFGAACVLDACAETAGCQRWVLGVVDEEPGDVPEDVIEEEPVQETLNAVRRQAIDANRRAASAPLARLGAPPRWQTRGCLARAAAAILGVLDDPRHTDALGARKAVDQAVRDARKALRRRDFAPPAPDFASLRAARVAAAACSLAGATVGDDFALAELRVAGLDLLAACALSLGGVVDVDDPQGARALDVYAPQMSSSLRAALRSGASTIELQSAFRAATAIGGLLDAHAWKRVADVAAKGDDVWRQATVASILLRDASRCGELAAHAPVWRATCRDGALLIDDGGAVPEYLPAIACAACLLPPDEAFPDDALVALALRVCGTDEAHLSATAALAASTPSLSDDQRSCALGEVAKRGAPGAAFDACAKAGVAPPAAFAASVLDPLERALASGSHAAASLNAAARLTALDDVGATRRCLIMALRACRAPWRAIAADAATAALAPAAVLLAKPLPVDVAAVLPELAVARRRAFLNDGAEQRVADAAAAALLKSWAASKPDAAQASAAGAALADALDAGLLNVVAPYLPPRGEAVLGSAAAAAFAAEMLPRLAAKASTGDAALDRLATPLLIAAALTAPVTQERAALLADLLEAPLSALLKSDDGAGDVLVKVATGHVELFKDAVGRLSPSVLADVKAGMGRAAARARAPQPPVSPAGGGVKLDMSAYR